MKSRSARFWFVLTLLHFCLGTGSSWGHGVSTTGEQIEPIQRPSTWLDWLIPEVQSKASVRVDKQGGYRYITSDGLADHRTGQFPNRRNPNRIQRQSYEFRLPLNPSKSARVTPNRHATFGVAINGVPFDPATAEFYRNDRRWNEEAIGGVRKLGLDSNNAHVQPNGAYHYHGLPMGILKRMSWQEGPVLVGWAADGFPIYGPYGHEDGMNTGSAVVALRSSYRVKSGTRPSGPGGRYDGSYTADWEYVQGLGDLDACNGRVATTPEFPDGTYHYVLTDTFPFIPRCWVGQPDGSFMKGRGGGGRGQDRGMGRGGSGGMNAGGGRGHRGPPPQATEACQGSSEGDTCSFETPRGALSGQCGTTPMGELACMPEGHRRRGPPGGF